MSFVTGAVVCREHDGVGTELVEMASRRSKGASKVRKRTESEPAIDRRRSDRDRPSKAAALKLRQHDLSQTATSASGAVTARDDEHSKRVEITISSPVDEAATLPARTSKVPGAVDTPPMENRQLPVAADAKEPVAATQLQQGPTSIRASLSNEANPKE